MAGPAFPSWAYNATQPAQIVQTQAAFNALGAGWAFSPFAPPGQIAPFDPGFVDTDIRLQQILVELRMLNVMSAQAFQITEDPQTQLRPDILANDAALAT